MVWEEFAQLKTSLPSPDEWGVSREKAMTVHQPTRQMRFAEEARRHGDLVSALSELETVIDQHPYFAPAYFEAGCIHFATGDLERAESYLSLAVALDPSEGEIQLALGRVLHVQGRYAEAVEPLRRAVGLLESDTEAWQALAAALQASGRPEDARRSLDVVRGLNAPNGRSQQERSYSRPPTSLVKTDDFGSHAERPPYARDWER